MHPALVSVAAGDFTLRELAAPLPLADLVRDPPADPADPADPPSDAPWEIELGFGKGRYLLARCRASPERRFLGIEIAAEYQRLFVGRARRRGVANWVALRGDALYLASAVLPAGFAAAVHVYFPDPWPKSRHQKRRLFDAETVDLVLGLLRPGGRLFFATDFLDYGERVAELLAGCPGLALERRRAWDEGPRTNYEAKYEAEGRPIVRLEATLAAPAVLHPRGIPAIVGPDRLAG